MRLPQLWYPDIHCWEGAKVHDYLGESALGLQVLKHNPRSSVPARDCKVFVSASAKFPSKFIVVLCLLTAGLLTYAQFVAYWGDESLHLVAAQLIIAGKRPYIDFFYQHPPVFAYVLAAVMRVFGTNWRVAHALSALFTSGCGLLVWSFVHSRIKTSFASLSALFFFGLNVYVISFATVALPYGFCLFMMTAAMVLITERTEARTWITFGAGVCAGAAAASYFLTAPVLLILLVWMIRHNRQGSAARKCLWFLFGASLPLVPLILLAARAPHQVWSDLVHHLYHRAGRELDLWFNLREIAGWFISAQGIMLVLLTGAGICHKQRRKLFEGEVASELNLIVALSACLAAAIGFARPVSSFYYVLITPFLAIGAALGIYVLVGRINNRYHRLRRNAFILMYVLGISAFSYVWSRQMSYADHRTVKQIATVVDEVTPPAGMIYAFEAVYFEAQRLPPNGLENRFNPDSPADEWLKNGRFDTICISSANPRVGEFKLLERYHQRWTTRIDGIDFFVLWDKDVARASRP